MERKMIVRKYKETDCRETAALFYETVHNVNRRDYSRRQCEAWAPEKRNLTAWNERFLRHFSFVAVEDGKIIGFGDIDDDGYLDRLFVHKDHQRREAASALCWELENAASFVRIPTHASITARPFFEKRGYRVLKEQQAERDGVLLTNYLMEKVPTSPLSEKDGIAASK